MIYVLCWCMWRHQMETFSALLQTFVRGIHRPPVGSPHKGQWRATLEFSLIYAWTNDWANNRDADDLKRHRAHYDVVTVRVNHSPFGTCSIPSPRSRQVNAATSTSAIAATNATHMPCHSHLFSIWMAKLIYKYLWCILPLRTSY